MTQKILIENRKWDLDAPYTFCQELEKGNILFFPEIPFPFPQEEIAVLLEQNQSEEALQMHEILKNYSKRSIEFLSKLLFPYAKEWKAEDASLRSFQKAEGRQGACQALLNVDSSPAKPLFGDRILRFFTNINPKESRRWVTAESFGELVKRYGGSKKLSFPSSGSHSFKERWNRKIKLWFQKAGLKFPIRSPYDHFMLKMHHFLKENECFQKGCQKTYWEFSPHSCWAVFTDQVSHAALSGKYALEQTFLIPRRALLHPENSPLTILERMTDKILN